MRVTSNLRVWAVSSLVIVLCISHSFAVSNLSPFRASNKQAGYTIDTVGDKKQSDESSKIKLLVRVCATGKYPVKPADICLVDASGKKINPSDRSDKIAGSEEENGLPLVVGSGTIGTTAGRGSTGVGIGMQTTRFVQETGPYSYTKVEFSRRDFTPGKKLKVVLPNKKELVLPLIDLAE